MKKTVKLMFVAVVPLAVPIASIADCTRFTGRERGECLRALNNPNPINCNAIPRPASCPVYSNTPDSTIEQGATEQGDTVVAQDNSNSAGAGKSGGSGGGAGILALGALGVAMYHAIKKGPESRFQITPLVNSDSKGTSKGASTTFAFRSNLHGIMEFTQDSEGVDYSVLRLEFRF